MAFALSPCSVSQPMTARPNHAMLILLSATLSFFLLLLRHRKAALVLAGVLPRHPLGTLFGIVTLISLTRPQARSTFGR
jgi:hypothetical protein